jgi:hypothetical protein
MNKTNYESIADILGESDTKNWPGRPIILYPDKTPFNGKLTPCVRVKAYQKPAVAPAKPAPTEINPPPHVSVPEDMDDEIPF